MAFDIVPFTPAKATPQEWARFHEHRRARSLEVRPEAPVQSDTEARAELVHPDEAATVDRDLVLDGDRVVAAFTLHALSPDSVEYATGGHICRATGGVRSAWRRRGIAWSYLPTVLAFMERHGTTVLETNTKEADGHAFLARIGAEQRSAQAQSRLHLDAVDWDLVREWIVDSERRSPSTKVEVYSGRLPEARFDEVSEATTEFINDVPFDGLDHGDIVITPATLRGWYERFDATGTGHDVVLLRANDGAIAALTDIAYSRGSPTELGQRFTGVRAGYRGRGYAKWVKAAMLEHVRQAFPTARWVATENAATNAAMLAVNARLGFRLDRVKAIYQIDRGKLAHVVRSRSQDLPTIGTQPRQGRSP